MTIDEAIAAAKDELETQIRRVIQMAGHTSNDAIFRVHDGFSIELEGLMIYTKVLGIGGKQ